MRVIENKDNFLAGLNWNTKRTNRNIREDVSVTLVKGTKKVRNRINVTFRNDVEDLVCPSGYIICAMHENKIYFRDSDSKNGYTLAKKEVNDTTTNFQFTVPEHELPVYAEFVGDYELCHDPIHNVYYIEKED